MSERIPGTKMTHVEMSQNGRILATVGGVVFLIAAGLIIFAILSKTSKAEVVSELAPTAGETTLTRTTTTTTTSAGLTARPSPAVVAAPAAATVTTGAAAATADKAAAAHQTLAKPEHAHTHWAKLKKLLDAYATAHPNDRGVQSIVECLRTGGNCDDEAYAKFEDLDHGLIQQGKKRLERAIQNAVRTNCLHEPEGEQHLCIAFQRTVGYGPAVKASNEHEYAALVEQSQRDRSNAIHAAPSSDPTGSLTIM